MITPLDSSKAALTMISSVPIKINSKGTDFCQIIGLLPKETEVTRVKLGWELFPLIEKTLLSDKPSQLLQEHLANPGFMTTRIARWPKYSLETVMESVGKYNFLLTH